MSEPFIAQITMFGGNFAPRGWAFCNGQLLSISSNTALFSLIGTIYGGDGRTTFALPDLRGRQPMHPGTGPGLSTYNLGQRGGTEFKTLSIAEMPSHNHTAAFTPAGGGGGIPATTEDAGEATPGPNLILGTTPAGQEIYSDDPANTTIQGGSGGGGTVNVGNTGGNQQFSLRDPFLAVNYIIALQGIFPSRS